MLPMVNRLSTNMQQQQQQQQQQRQETGDSTISPSSPSQTRPVIDEVSYHNSVLHLVESEDEFDRHLYQQALDLGLQLPLSKATAAAKQALRASSPRNVTNSVFAHSSSSLTAPSLFIPIPSQQHRPLNRSSTIHKHETADTAASEASGGNSSPIITPLTKSTPSTTTIITNPRSERTAITTTSERTPRHITQDVTALDLGPGRTNQHNKHSLSIKQQLQQQFRPNILPAKNVSTAQTALSQHRLSTSQHTTTHSKRPASRRHSSLTTSVLTRPSSTDQTSSQTAVVPPSLSGRSESMHAQQDPHLDSSRQHRKTPSFTADSITSGPSNASTSSLPHRDTHQPSQQQQQQQQQRFRAPPDPEQHLKPPPSYGKLRKGFRRISGLDRKRKPTDNSLAEALPISSAPDSGLSSASATVRSSTATTDTTFSSTRSSSSRSSGTTPTTPSSITNSSDLPIRPTTSPPARVEGVGNRVPTSDSLPTGSLVTPSAGSSASVVQPYPMSATTESSAAVRSMSQHRRKVAAVPHSEPPPPPPSSASSASATNISNANAVVTNAHLQAAQSTGSPTRQSSSSASGSVVQPPTPPSPSIPSDPIAIERSLSDATLKKLRTTQLQEQLRFISFRASQTRLLRTKHLQTKRDSLTVYKQAQADMESRHAQAVSVLEDQHLHGEGDLLKALDTEKASCETRLRHMQAYCNPREHIEGMPKRTITKADYKKLEEQYHVRNGMQALHTSRIKVLRETQTQQLERLLTRQEQEVKQLASGFEKETATLDQRFSGQERSLSGEFAERKQRLMTRWTMAEAIERRKLELETGQEYGPLPAIGWGDEGRDVADEEEEVQRIIAMKGIKVDPETGIMIMEGGESMQDFDNMNMI